METTNFLVLYHDSLLHIHLDGGKTLMRREHFVIDENAAKEPYPGCYIRIAEKGIWQVDKINGFELICGGTSFAYYDRVMSPREVKDMFALTEGLKEGDLVRGRRKEGGMVTGRIKSLFRTSFDSKVWITDKGYMVPLQDGTVEKI